MIKSIMDTCLLMGPSEIAVKIPVSTLCDSESSTVGPGEERSRDQLAAVEETNSDEGGNSAPMF